MDNPVIDKYGYKRWYQRGELHRDDGPAVEFATGYNAWYQHGFRHRDDGPAINYPSGLKEWYLSGQQLTFDTWLDTGNISDEEKVMMKLQYG
jgi:hypothetical protein